MKIPTKLLTRNARLLAVMLPLMTIAWASPAHAAGRRPFFQMPFVCGQTWEASTYNGHWPDQDSIDLGEWTTADGNMSQGQPVLASADGTVLDVFTSSGGDIRVYLDHGGGWVTHYIHLEQVPPLVKGQRVAQGEQIGRVGNTGTKEYHLHYSQLADGNAVRIAFNGELIDTHAGNLNSYNTWGNGERLTSANCPQNAFVRLDSNGQKFQLLYKPGTGAAKIVGIDAAGLGVSTTWSDTWTKGWTHFTPFSIGGVPHYFAYKSSTGEVDFDRGFFFGLGTQTIGEGTWSKGWTHFMPFSLGGTAYYVAYKSTNGGANLDRINAAGNGATTIWSGSWGKSWTHLVPFVQGGVQYFLAYQASTGAVEIDKITGGGNSVTITEVWAGTWAKSWANIVPVTHNGAVHLVKYNSVSGLTQFEKVKASGLGTQVLGSSTWTQGWTSFSPFTIGGQGHVLIYKTLTGAAKIVKLNPAGAGTGTIWSGSWTTGWN